jgi:5-hydroxyisourate hydrolase
MGFLTTHVLDTAQGVPGSNMSVSLYSILDGKRALLSQQMTNSDGRCEGPLLQDESFAWVYTN